MANWHGSSKRAGRAWLITETGCEGLKRSTGERTWADALGEVRHAAARHKLASGIVAICVAASLAAIGWAGTTHASSPGHAAAAADPAAPAFSFPVLGHSGQRVTLSDYAGKPLIVNFFASWCVDCKTETPLLATFYRTEHGKIALVGLDESDVVGNALSFTRAHGVTYPVGWDPGFIAASAYGVAAIPQTFFLNARHRIVDRIFGAVTLAELEKGIALATGTSATVTAGVTS
jgi:cytochrome c biogenesis protein CcmG, thiol:disulfide interchange protein DsbE